MVIELQPLVLGGLMPGAAGVLCLCLAGRTDRGWLRAMLGLMLFADILAGFLALRLGSLPPDDTWQLLPWFAVIASLINFLPRNINIFKIFSVLILSCLGFLLVPNFERLADERIYWLGAMIIALFISLTSSLLSAQKLTGPALPFYWLLISVGATLLTLSASLLKFTQLGGMLVAVVAGCLIAAWLYPQRGVAQTIAPGWAVLFPGLVLEARLYTFSEVPLTSFLLVLMAPLMIWLTALPGVRKMKPIWRTTIGTLGVLAPLAIGLSLAGQVALRDVEEW
jgi:MFS family permease